MSVDADLLRAIVENPEDLGPRLVYADWLMEQGDPRGEFIVAQCRAVDESVGDVGEWSRAERRADELLAKHGKPWREPFRRAGVRRYEFRRGFVEGFTLNAERSLDSLGELLDSSPVRTLKVRKLKRNVERFAACPGLARLRMLNLTGAEVSGRRASQLLASPHLSNLEELYASSNGFGRMGAAALVRVPWTRLHTLDLANNRITPDATRILADGLPETLRHLDLFGNPQSDESIACLCRSPRLASLRFLDVSASWSVAGGWTETADPEAVTESSARSLVAATFANALEVLKISGWRMGPTGQQLLAERFGTLKALETRDGVDEL